jgi:phospholipase/carboxylesterase
MQALLTVIFGAALLVTGCSGVDYETWGAPLSGAGHIVVLFHGYGAPPLDLKGLAIDLKEYGAPADTCYIFAAGPHGAGSGRSWYRNGEDLEKLRPKIAKLLDSLMGKAGLESQKVFVAGFSQGATVAVDAGLHYPLPLGGVLAFSGSRDPTGRWWSDPLSLGYSKAPFLISHGSSDTVVSPGVSEELRKTLETHKYTVNYLKFAGGHEIPKEIKQAAGKFIEKYGR